MTCSLIQFLVMDFSEINHSVTRFEIGDGMWSFIEDHPPINYFSLV